MTKYFDDKIIHDKIDIYLMKIAALESSIGKDSTKSEFTKIKYKQNKILEKIKELDSEFYDILVP